MQTRYYDPDICRFISADDPEILGDLASVVGQLNLYAYCLNNPVMFTDETGQLFLALIIAGAVVGGAFGALSAAAAGRNVLWGFVFGAVSGAVLGLLSALETPVLLMALSSGALSAVSELLQQNINNEDRNWDRIRYNAFISVAMGALGGWFGDWAKVSACLDDFCQVGLTAITDSATNAIGLGINAIIESLIK